MQEAEVSLRVELLLTNSPVEEYKIDSRGYVFAELLRDYNIQ